jgi:hypothetical protein
MGNVRASISAITWRIYRFETNNNPSLVKEANFSDRTPYKPRIVVEPNETQYLPFNFFSEWQDEKETGFIEVELFHEASSKPIKRRFVSIDEIVKPS